MRAPIDTLVAVGEYWLVNNCKRPPVVGAPAALSNVPDTDAVRVRDIEKSAPVICCETPTDTNCASLAFGVPG